MANNETIPNDNNTSISPLREAVEISETANEEIRTEHIGNNSTRILNTDDNADGDPPDTDEQQEPSESRRLSTTEEDDENDDDDRNLNSNSIYSDDEENQQRHRLDSARRRSRSSVSSASSSSSSNSSSSSSSSSSDNDSSDSEAKPDISLGIRPNSEEEEDVDVENEDDEGISSSVKLESTTAEVRTAESSGLSEKEQSEDENDRRKESTSIEVDLELSTVEVGSVESPCLGEKDESDDESDRRKESTCSDVDLEPSTVEVECTESPGFGEKEESEDETDRRKASTSTEVDLQPSIEEVVSAKSPGLGEKGELEDETDRREALTSSEVDLEPSIEEVVSAKSPGLDEKEESEDGTNRRKASTSSEVDLELSIEEDMSAESPGLDENEESEDGTNRRKASTSSEVDLEPSIEEVVSAKSPGLGEKEESEDETDRRKASTSSEVDLEQSIEDVMTSESPGLGEKEESEDESHQRNDSSSSDVDLEPSIEEVVSAESPGLDEKDESDQKKESTNDVDLKPSTDSPGSGEKDDSDVEMNSSRELLTTKSPGLEEEAEDDEFDRRKESICSDVEEQPAELPGSDESKVEVNSPEPTALNRNDDEKSPGSPGLSEDDEVDVLRNDDDEDDGKESTCSDMDIDEPTVSPSLDEEELPKEPATVIEKEETLKYGPEMIFNSETTVTQKPMNGCLEESSDDEELAVDDSKLTNGEKEIVTTLGNHTENDSNSSDDQNEEKNIERPTADKYASDGNELNSEPQILQTTLVKQEVDESMASFDPAEGDNETQLEEIPKEIKKETYNDAENFNEEHDEEEEISSEQESKLLEDDTEVDSTYHISPEEESKLLEEDGEDITELENTNDKLLEDNKTESNNCRDVEKEINIENEYRKENNHFESNDQSKLHSDNESSIICPIKDSLVEPQLNFQNVKEEILPSKSIISEMKMLEANSRILPKLNGDHLMANEDSNMSMSSTSSTNLVIDYPPVNTEKKSSTKKAKKSSTKQKRKRSICENGNSPAAKQPHVEAQSNSNLNENNFGLNSRFTMLADFGRKENTLNQSIANHQTKFCENVEKEIFASYLPPFPSAFDATKKPLPVVAIQPTKATKTKDCSNSATKLLNVKNQMDSLLTMIKLSQTPQTQTTIKSSSDDQTKRKVFLCSCCQKYYDNTNFVYHMKMVHNRHICIYCTKFFPNADKLSLHLENKHDLEQNHFDSPEQFLKTSRGDEQFFLMCCTCEHIFADNEKYSDHVCLEYMQPCSLCGQKGRHSPQCADRKSPSKKKAHTSSSSKSICDTKSNNTFHSLPPIKLNGSIITSDAATMPGNRLLSSLLSAPLQPPPPPPVLPQSPNPVQPAANNSEESNHSDTMVIDEQCSNYNNNNYSNTDGTNVINPFKRLDEAERLDNLAKHHTESHTTPISDAIPEEKPLIVPKLMLRIPKEYQKPIASGISSASESEEDGGEDEEEEEEQSFLDDSIGNADESQLSSLERIQMAIEQTKMDIEKTKKTKQAIDRTPEQHPMAIEPPHSFPNVPIQTSPEHHVHLSPEYQPTDDDNDITPPIADELGEEQPPPPLPYSSPRPPPPPPINSDVDDDDGDNNGNETPQQTLDNLNIPTPEPESEIEPDPVTEIPSTQNDSLTNDEADIDVENDEKPKIPPESPCSQQPPEEEQSLTPRPQTPPTSPQPKYQPPADGIALADDSIITVDLLLDRPLDKFSMLEFIRICLKASYPICLYCNHARRIAVNGNSLALHLLADHRFSATVDSITAEELLPKTIVAKLKSFLPELEEYYFNMNSYCNMPHDKDLTLVTDERTFECFLCRFSTSVHKELYLHNRKMHLKTAILCFMCRCNFFSYSEILCHICPGRPHKVDFLDIKFRCCLCDLDQIPSPFRLMVHLRKKHVACDICLEYCHNQHKLSSHVWKHKLHHLCYRCGIAYRNKQDITKHLFWKHGTESIICKRCLQKRWRYVYHFCVPPASFVCDVCNLCFTQAKYLKVHKRLHLDDLRYPCTDEDCEEKFVSRKLLLKHAVVHVPPAIEPPMLVEVKEEPIASDEVEEEEERKENSEDMVVVKSEEDAKTKDEESKEPEVKPDEAVTAKRKKKKNRRENKESLDDLNLTAPNLSESDSSDESDVEKPKGDLQNFIPNPMLSPPSEDDKDETEKKTTVDDGKILDIWANFKSFQESQATKKDDNDDELDEDNIPTPILHVAQSDHDYCQLFKTVLKRPRPETIYTENRELNRSMRDMLGEDSQSPKKRMKRKSNRSGSDSSSDSDSSSSSGCCSKSDCSCSSSGSSSGSSSSSSSDDSDSSSSEGRRRVAAKRQAKLEKNRLKSESSPVKISHPNTSGEIIDIESNEFKEPETAPISEPVMVESDLDTAESDTDEDFYDDHPQKLSNDLLAEKRRQLLSQTSLSPSHNFDIVENSRPSTPSLPEEVFKEKKVKLKKKKRDRKSSSRVVMGVKIPPLKLNISQSQQPQPDLPSPQPEIHQTAILAPEVDLVPPFDLIASPIATETPPPPPPLTETPKLPLNMLYQQRSLFPHAPVQSSTLPPIAAPIPYYSRPSTGSSCSDADASLKRSKRARRPNKFYGYTSDDENNHQHRPFMQGQIMAGAAAFKPTPPPNLTWAKEDLPTPSKSILNKSVRQKTPKLPKIIGSSSSLSTGKKSLKRERPRKTGSSGSVSTKKRRLDELSLPPIPRLKIRQPIYLQNKTTPAPASAPPEIPLPPAAPTFPSRQMLASQIYSSSKDSSDSDSSDDAAPPATPAPPAAAIQPLPLPPPPVPEPQPAAPVAKIFNQKVPPALLPNPDLATLQYFKRNNIRYPIRPPAGARPPREGESVYCYCRCPYDEVSEMIACDGNECAIEWFHFECVGIMVAPQGTWYCAECRPKYFNQLYPA